MCLSAPPSAWIPSRSPGGAPVHSEVGRALPLVEQVDSSASVHRCLVSVSRAPALFLRSPSPRGLGGTGTVGEYRLVPGGVWKAGGGR